MDLNDIFVVQSGEIQAIDRLISKLQGWADWEAKYTANPLKSGQACFVVRGSYDFDGLFSQVESKTYQIIDTAIDDLPKDQRSAILTRYTHRTWLSTKEAYADLLNQAHEALLITLPKKNVIF